ncbi:MAG TPA: hypothetical protein VK864_00275 [Longimicrobiales bacterium]|nr:hypothetical protein [Longimicrobiales bacterium]
MRPRYFSFAAILVSGTVLAACADRPGDPLSVQAALDEPKPLVCPSSAAQTSTALITPLGGIVSIDGASITIPALAVLQPTIITIGAPASQYMEVDITANGLTSFLFQLPVTVSVSYARCTRDLSQDSLTVWHWNPASQTLLENMNGRDDKEARTMTFSTSHLSGYVIAN